MPILIDFSQFCISSIFSSMEDGFSKKEVLDINIIRHVLLNSIRSNRKKFFNKYGELVICVDSSNPWRNDIFPYYKIRRKRAKKESDIDWSKMFDLMAEIREELSTVFPYKVIKIDRCEADDIIGTICKHHGELNDEKVLILSRDKDFKQLLKYDNVNQYDQRDKKFITVDDPNFFLKTMIITGDKDDDIPNVLSPDDVFADSLKRQKPMTEKRKESILLGEYQDDMLEIRTERNRKLIDLSMIPQNYQDEILKEYDEKVVNGRSGLYKFFCEKNMKFLLQDLGDF